MLGERVPQGDELAGMTHVHHSYRVVRLLVDLGLHSSWAGTVSLDSLSMLDLTTSSGCSGLQACVDPHYGQVRNTQVPQHSGGIWLPCKEAASDVW